MMGVTPVFLRWGCAAEGPAIEALQQALEDLTAICDAMESKYDEALEAFEAKTDPMRQTPPHDTN